ncbi:uncharacterized protein At1g01500-like [Elaeis guineensis]|uniref:LOW QUALITY PROTEIN: uncharacterized protein At1g01500-like n=1 Tax=Elaeis guineensis var. tenera TaxID=51953 RepID=A0A6I9SBP9_ELAGV|nr:LOW QUALITY PROTEIN: uncharacterized protein At1g01500-like [Elaeis guineensis]
MMDPPPPTSEEKKDHSLSLEISLPSPPPARRGPAGAAIHFSRLLPNGPPANAVLSTWLEVRLFYVRITPCAADAVPPRLTLSHLRREMGAALEINGARVPNSDPTSLPLRRDRLDRDAAEVTYVSTEGVRLTGAVDFEVCDDWGNLILCGSLERVEAPWSNGVIGFDNHSGSCDKDPKTGWSMDCYSVASISSSAFMQPKLGISSPSIEVYVAGCYAGVPLILTQTVQLSPRRKAVRPGALDAIPEGEETAGREQGSNEGLIHGRTPSSVTEEIDEYDPNMKVGHSYYPEGWYSDDDGQLTWFNAGVRVGVGIGLGMCIGIGIGVGLLMRSYQATTRNFRRRFF